jgi:MoxR-like ATPase
MASTAAVSSHVHAQPRIAAALVGSRLIANVERVIHGRRVALEFIAASVLAGGHVLIQDVPGSGKTTLARAFAQSIGGSFRRVQGTADLLPADITGSAIWEPDRHAFSFMPGPVFANVLLIDELNRATPRAQSALLEAMDEAAVTVDGVRHPLPTPFFTIATQNPIEQHGTFPLPEAQLDRFAVGVELGPNDLDTERRVVREQLVYATVEDLVAVVSTDDLAAAQLEVRRTHIADAVLDFALNVVRGTRDHPAVRSGASSRAALSFVRCAQARALLAGRDFVVPDDMKVLAGPCLGHRLVLSRGTSAGVGAGSSAGEIVAEVVASTPVPLRS